MRKLLLLFASLFVFCSFLQNNNGLLGSFTLPDDNETVSLIFTGDIMGHSPQYKAAYDAKTNSFDYSPCFRYVKPYIEQADFAIANLEVPLGGMPYSGYPNFSSPDALLDGLKNAGYDVMLTANNHVLDRGKAGLERTIRIIGNRKLKYAGSYVSQAQRDSVYPLILEKKGLRIALLNYTYGTNGHVAAYPNVVNMIDTVQIKEDIAKAKQKADVTVLTIHWGVEYELKGNEIQTQLARLFVREGVDLVIGGHPHVVQNAEFINKDSSVVTVFYSLGNSVSNQRKTDTNGGIMVNVKIGVRSKKIINSEYLPVYVHRGVLNNKYQFHLIPTIDFIKSPASFPIPAVDSAALVTFDKRTRERLSNVSVFDKGLTFN